MDKEPMTQEEWSQLERDMEFFVDLYEEKLRNAKLPPEEWSQLEHDMEFFVDLYEEKFSKSISENYG